MRNILIVVTLIAGIVVAYFVVRAKPGSLCYDGSYDTGYYADYGVSPTETELTREQNQNE